MGTVEVGGIKKGNAGFDGVVDELDHVGVGLGKPVKGGHTHASEALLGDLQALRSELDFGHIYSHFGGIENLSDESK